MSYSFLFIFQLSNTKQMYNIFPPPLLCSCCFVTWLHDWIFIHCLCFLLASEPGFSSSAEEEETSGYESEGGPSLSPGAPEEPAPSVSPSTGRRPRTAFTAEQINSLERAFKRNAYLGAQDKAELCKRLNLSDKQVWARFIIFIITIILNGFNNVI